MAHPGGRPRMIESPEELWELFEQYKAWAKENPWIKKDFIKSGPFAGDIIDLKIERPLTEWEFATHSGMSRACLIQYGKREEFVYIYSCIKDEMTAQRISGGLAEQFNASLVARIDGLTDKQEIQHTVDIAESLALARKRAGLE